MAEDVFGNLFDCNAAQGYFLGTLIGQPGALA